MDITKRFMAVFEGFGAAHGQTTISDSRRGGKQEAKSRIIREPLTEALVQKHLDGEQGVGSIPITERNDCRFGVIDVDVYPLDLNAIARQCASLKLPAIVCRSKSGGAHIYFFVKGWVAAADMRDKLSEIAAILGHGGSEIFPKQEQLLVERGDVGNFINLPYFDADLTTRPALDAKGNELSLEEFLDKAEKIAVTPNKFLSIEIADSSTDMPGAPPCLLILAMKSFGSGERNLAMTQMAIYRKQQDPAHWQQQLEKDNQTYCNPPLSASEVVSIQQSIDRKEYFYMCNQSPFKDHCDKAACRRCEFGIGGGSSVEVTGLSVVESDPRVWFVDVNGGRLEVSTEELQMFQRFQRACMEQLNFMPPEIKKSDWEIIVNGLMQQMVVIEVPEELTYKGQFVDMLEGFCNGRVQAQSAEELMLGKPWTEDGRTYFRLDSFMEFLRAKNFSAYTRGQIQERLKELNSGKVASESRRFADTKGKSKVIRVWSIPEFGVDPDIPQPDVRGEEVPF